MSLLQVRTSPPPTAIIHGSTKLYGLIGHPVSHSLSPAMHNAALAALGIDAAYVPFPVESNRLEAAIAGLDAIGVCGFNITIPHKQTVLPWLTSVSDPARAVGAVNTVYRLPDGSWGGTNTDVAGFTRPLPALNWRDRQALVLGSGGAARAVIQGCLQLGFASVRVVGRSGARLAVLETEWPHFVRPIFWKDIASVLPDSDLVVNATPIGMHSDSNPEAERQSPLNTAELSQLPDEAIVYDLIYTPRPTHLLSMAKSRGLMAIDGLEMLVQQGAIALSLWLGDRDVPIDVMREAAERQLS